MEGEDEADRLVKVERKRRNKYFEYAYRIGLGGLAVFLVLHWMTGFSMPTPTWVYVTFMALPALSLLNYFGIFDGHGDLRYRTKEINARLAAIEKAMAERGNISA
jgi:hypothetical protein